LHLKRFKRGLRYAIGMINIFAWLAISASVCVIMPNIVLGLAAYWNPDFVPQKYHSFLLYQASNLLILAYNIAILRRASWTHNVGMVFGLLCFLTFFIACLAKASPKLPSSYVWSTFANGGSG
jgi:choline transport protein